MPRQNLNATRIRFDLKWGPLYYNPKSPKRTFRVVLGGRPYVTGHTRWADRFLLEHGGNSRRPMFRKWGEVWDDRQYLRRIEHRLQRELKP